MRYLHSPVREVQYSRKTQLDIIGRLLFKRILPGGPGRLTLFIRTFLRAPRTA